GGEAPPQLAAMAPAGDGEPPLTGSLVIEGGGDFPDEPDAEPNFNREGAPHVSAGGGDRPRGGDRGGDRGRGGRPGGGGGGGGRGRGRGGRPGGGGGGGGRHSG